MGVGGKTFLKVSQAVKSANVLQFATICTNTYLSLQVQDLVREMPNLSCLI